MAVGAPPAPIPQLDGPPASPPGTGAGAPSGVASFEGLAPQQGADMVGSLQVVQLTLQTAQAVAQGLDILGKINPAFGGLSAQMQTMLREGVRSALQQGTPGSESSGSSFTQMGGGIA